MSIYYVQGASLVAQMIKNLPAMQETWFRYLGQEDPLEGKVATHSSILMEKGAWWATISGVTKHQTQLSIFQTLFYTLFMYYFFFAITI